MNIHVSTVASCLPEESVWKPTIVWLMVQLFLFSSTLIESLKEALLFQVKLLWLVKFPNGKNNNFISPFDWYLVDLLTLHISYWIHVDERIVHKLVTQGGIRSLNGWFLMLCFSSKLSSCYLLGMSTFQAVLWRYKFSQLKGSSDDGKSKIKFLFQNQDSKSIEAKVILSGCACHGKCYSVSNEVKENEIVFDDFSIDSADSLSGAGVLKSFRCAPLHSCFLCCQSGVSGPDVCGEPRHCNYNWVSFPFQYLM